MRGQTILLHAVSLTNDYTTKQYVHMMYESKAACQAWITVGQAQALNRKIWELLSLCLFYLCNGTMFTLPGQFCG